MEISKCEKYKNLIVSKYNDGKSARDISDTLPEKIYYTSILNYLKKIGVETRKPRYRGYGKTKGLFTKCHDKGFKKGQEAWNKKEIQWEENENGCWICTSHKTNKGYPILCRNVIISRYMYEEYIGEITSGMLVCHKCDNPICINPEHLFLGTNKDNMIDKCNKNRQSKGEDIGTSKLKENEVREIKYGYKGELYKDIAKKYNISITTVTNIKNNKTWKHI